MSDGSLGFKACSKAALPDGSGKWLEHPKTVRGNESVNRLHTPKEISGLLQVSESTVLRMAYSGALSYILVWSGKRKKIIRFYPITIKTYLKAREKTGIQS